MRRRVLHQLRVYARAASAVEVGEPLGLHPNTARFHLDALVEAGLAERTTEGRATPGRPKVLYAVPPGDVAEEDSYRVLAEILTGALEHAASTPAAAAGAQRGRALAAEQVGPVRARMTATRAADVVVEGLGRLGFESSAASTRVGRRIDIVPCPYLDLARSRPDVVCAVHRGLMQGVLDQLGAPLEVDRLEPFAEPGRCVAHLRRAG